VEIFSGKPKAYAYVQAMARSCAILRVRGHRDRDLFCFLHEAETATEPSFLLRNKQGVQDGNSTDVPQDGCCLVRLILLYLGSSAPTDAPRSLAAHGGSVAGLDKRDTASHSRVSTESGAGKNGYN
jgi:hypothetical protein